MSLSLKQRLSEGTLFADGAMGTQLMLRGIEGGKCNDYLNIESPKVIKEIHLSYFLAGSDMVYTNTFGANEITLGHHNLADKVEAINTAGVQNARLAAEAAGGEGKYVIGDIGPCGEFLEPVGTLKADTLRKVFARQAKALYEAGVDGMVIETFMSADEAKIAVEGVKSVCSLPLFVSMAFTSAGNDFRTMMGASVEQEVKIFSQIGIDAMGFNCGVLQMEQYLQLTEKFAKLLAGKNIKLLAKPNGGKPELVDGKAAYKLSDNEFGDWLLKINKAGAAILGGCCGTSPAHIKAMVTKIKL